MYTTLYKYCFPAVPLTSSHAHEEDNEEDEEDEEDMAVTTSSSTISSMVSTPSPIEATPLLISAITTTTQGTPSSLMISDDPALWPSVLDDNVTLLGKEQSKSLTLISPEIQKPPLGDSQKKITEYQ